MLKFLCKYLWSEIKSIPSRIYIKSIFGDKLSGWWSDDDGLGEQKHYSATYLAHTSKCSMVLNRYNIVWDTPKGVVLFYRGDEIACIGFEIDPDNTIHVKQIQGVKGRGKELQPLRWEKLLLDIVISLAEKMNCEAVHVQPAKKNTWFHSFEVSKEKLKLRYNVTAKRMGFEYDEDIERYALAIQ